MLWSSARKPLISTFIACYIYCGGLFLCPPTGGWRQTLLAPFWGLIEYVGLWQYYCVFVPPRMFNLYLEASVTLDNGGVIIWKYPRMELLGLFEKLQKERYRKFYNDVANYPPNEVLWPDLARYIARRVYAQQGKRPVEVTLVRYTSDLPTPTGDPQKPLVDKYESTPFFTYPVQIEDLR